MESSHLTNRKIERVKVVSSWAAVITVDGTNIKISIDKLALKKYKKNTEISDSEWQELLLSAVEFLAKDYSLRLLAYGSKSRQEIKKKIKTKIGFWLSKNNLVIDKVIIDKIIQYNLTFLEEKNIIDDDAYADSLLRRYKNKSKRQLFFKLIGKGVDKSIAESKLSNFEDRERNAIRSIIARKTRMKASFSKDEKRKLLASLYRKGFSISVAKIEIDDLMKTK